MGARGLVPPLPRRQQGVGGTRSWGLSAPPVPTLPSEGTALSSFSLRRVPSPGSSPPPPRMAVLGSLGLSAGGGAALTVSPRPLSAALHGAGEGEWHRGGQALPAAEAEGAALLRDGRPESWALGREGAEWGGHRWVLPASCPGEGGDRAAPHPRGIQGQAVGACSLMWGWGSVRLFIAVSGGGRGVT